MMESTEKMDRFAADYAASTSSTTSETISGSMGKRSVRCIRLFRPKVIGTISRNPATGRSGPGFGFSIRGGHEHGVGFFVSKVESGSEAAKQGLQVGDQIMRVNGHRVGDAVHSELLHFIACQTRLKMKVRNVGMIPSKEHINDPLTWHIVSELGQMFTPDKGTNSLYDRRNSNDIKEMRVSILVPPKSKLGCGLCKGPEWRPGIFVQFTKENGIARKAGLRPGDQIMKCNGIDFRDIQFADAILVMKKSNRLDLTIMPGIGSDLFATESSGYNSSASSAAGGDNSPPSSECKRLSIVTEETVDLADKYNQHSISTRLRKHSFDQLDTKWTKSSDFESDTETEIANDYHIRRENQIIRTQNLHRKLPQNATIINLSENGTTIRNCYDGTVLYPIVKSARSNSNVSQVEVGERKTIVVEIHQSHERDNIINDTTEDFNVPSESSYSSYASHAGGSLSSAISEEIKRRAERIKDGNAPTVLTEHCQKPNIIKNMDTKKFEQHTALMDEFRKAHRRMFAKEQQLDCEQNGIDAKDAISVNQCERQPLKLKSATIEKVNAFEKPRTNQTTLVKDKTGPPIPPPLPSNTDPISEHKQIRTASQASANHDEADNVQNNNLSRFDRPPSTPTPDYDSLERPMNKIIPINGNSIRVLNEEPVKSPKIVSPSSPNEKSSNVFGTQLLSNGTMKKSARPISITIGEYPSNVVRKEPSKLDFLGESKTDVIYRNSEPIGSRLQSELVKTLSRSNLKKKTEALDLKLSQKMDNLITDNKNFHMRYPDTGIVLTPPSISIPKISAKLVNSLAKINANNTNDVNGGNMQKMLPNFHQVTMVIKDNHIPSSS